MREGAIMSATVLPTEKLPGLVPGTWNIDPSHSEVGFSVRHFGISKVRGKFTKFSGDIVIATEVADSSVAVTIDPSSVDTSEPNRDAHLRSPDFFETDKHPEWTFVSTSVIEKGNDWVVAGELTIKGVSRPVELQLEFQGAGPDAYGGTRSGFTAVTTISRKEYGVDIDMPMPGGNGVVVGDKITISLEVEAVLQA
jgi:polyisoprenoid-binding protein YceI